MKYRITSEHSYGDKKVTMYVTETPNEEATFALQMLERFGLIAGVDNGEDSAGRARLRLAPVEETVQRAFDLAQEAFKVARKRGLMLALPDLNEINAEADAERAAKDEKKRDKATA